MLMVCQGRVPSVVANAIGTPHHEAVRISKISFESNKEFNRLSIFTTRFGV
jgi:hypothetical protein